MVLEGILTIDDEDRVGYNKLCRNFQQEMQQWEIQNFKLMKAISQFGFVIVKL